MSQTPDPFLQKLLATFRIEAAEHLQAISAGLIELEKAPLEARQKEILESVFREVHSLKGASRAVNFTDMESLCASLESAMAVLKRREVALSPHLFDLLHAAANALSHSLASGGELRGDKPHILALVQALEKSTRVSPPTANPDTQLSSKAAAWEARSDLPQKLEATSAPGDSNAHPAAFAKAPGAKPVAAEPALSMAQTVRISTAKLDDLFLQVEGLLSAKLAGRRRMAQLRDVLPAVAAMRSELTFMEEEIRHTSDSPKDSPKTAVAGNGKGNGSSRNIPPPKRVAEFLEGGRELVNSLEADLRKLAQAAEQDQRSLGAMVDRLLEDTRKLLMLPLSSLLDTFPQIVRSLARDQGKEVEWRAEGRGIEIDRRILEEIKDPLIHIIRNCIDHGIEKPEIRRQKGKPPQGTLWLQAQRANGNKVEIVVSDDGEGIDVAKVRFAAVKVGAALAEQELDDDQLLSLIFRSGVSSSPIITDLSGRGLGLAIVREKVEKLGGTVSVKSRPGMGASLRMLLPLTMATFRGVLVRVGGRQFLLPTASVERVGRVNFQEVKTVEGRETIQLHGELIPLARMESILELPRRRAIVRSKEDTPMVIVVLRHGGQRIAFAVEEVINEEEVLVKELGTALARVRHISGAAMPGGGPVVPILRVEDLMKSAATGSGQTADIREDEKKIQTILVAEDSITARALLKGALEMAGYRVQTAVDGADALAQLRTSEINLVVSDVEMPRMSGLDLTARIRADQKLGDLPVVLVTALESREDRERGIDAGANAYIVKSSFDQSNLLEVVRRLI